MPEAEALAELRAAAAQNKVLKSFIGQGYYGTLTPAVILRNVLENPGWYTAYTPYQAEISQGRLEALLNFQTMIVRPHGLAIANASLLDEATAAAEAMTLCAARGARRDEPSASSSPTTATRRRIAVVRTRAEPLGIEVVVGDQRRSSRDADVFGVSAAVSGHQRRRSRLRGARRSRARARRLVDRRGRSAGAHAA